MLKRPSQQPYLKTTVSVHTEVLWSTILDVHLMIGKIFHLEKGDSGQNIYKQFRKDSLGRLWTVGKNKNDEILTLTSFTYVSPCFCFCTQGNPTKPLFNKHICAKHEQMSWVFPRSSGWLGQCQWQGRWGPITCPKQNLCSISQSKSDSTAPGKDRTSCAFLCMEFVLCTRSKHLPKVSSWHQSLAKRHTTISQTKPNQRVLS